ncbi:MAG TPA: small ribosomal subunit Rsm22 family protein, partial [Rectinemataceae bacterium]|nr:small ribosomal subunit Rsm22 family protein [Rectinemataceae bacterium]
MKGFSPSFGKIESHALPIEKLESLTANSDTSLALEALPAIFDEVVPLNQRHRLELGRTIRLLWEDLTSEREHRTAEYLSSPAYYSAYVRYFLPWNIVRLTSILSRMRLPLNAGAVMVDIGSGPLTIPIALYIARPDLRSLPLTIYCTDKTERILKVGQTIFESLCAKLSGTLPPWKIILLRQPFGAHLPEKADLVTAANVFNEFFWKSKTPLGTRAYLTAGQILGYLKESGSIFFMEPGDPRSGSFMSAMRAAFSAFGGQPMAPCPHNRACPMPGLFHGLENPGSDSPLGIKSKPMESVIMPKRRDKYPWCHFTIGTEAAPAWLKKLSDEAGLPKEKLVFSYLLVTLPGDAADRKASDLARIVSEGFTLPD